jgi:hypothetical protein
MECRFEVEAKSFFFSAKKGAVLRLEEKRKGFGGFILLGTKCSVWLADVVGEAMVAQRKEVFARTCRDGERVLKVRLGSNKAGCFLEVAVFVEGSRKGVIRIPEGRGGWGWQRFSDELRTLVAHLTETDLPEISVANAGEVGRSPLATVVAAVPPGGLKSPVVEAQAQHRRPSPDCSLEALKSLAMVFLARIRAEVDRVIFFGLGLKVDATRDIRSRLGRVLSRMGLKPKLLFGSNLRGRRKPRCSVASRRRRRASVSASGQGETSPEMRSTSTVGVEESSVSMGSSQIVPGTILTATEAADFPEVTSPEFALVLEVAQSPPASQIVPETRLTLTEGVEESQIPMDSGVEESQILTATEAADFPEVTSPEVALVLEVAQSPPASQIVLLSPEPAQTAPVLVLPELPGLADVSEGSVSSATVMPAPQAQLLVNGLTESQAWFIGWLRDGTRSPELLDAIESVEVQARRKNEIGSPPVCSMELPKLKAMLEARIRDKDTNRETIVRRWVSAYLGDKDWG